MVDPKRLWLVEAALAGPASWLVIADNEDEAKDAAEELERDITVDWDVMPAGIKNGVLITCTNMLRNDLVLCADPDKDAEITLGQLQALIADWHQQRQREDAERNNGQITMPLQ